jgi:hypothetical protein
MRRTVGLSAAILGLSLLFAACSGGSGHAPSTGGSTATGGGTTTAGGGGGGGSSSTTTPPAPLVVTPGATTVETGGNTISFSIDPSSTTATAFVWSVNGIVGGDSIVGQITTAGVYTSPALLPTPQQVTISASASESGGTATGSATVTLTGPAPVQVSVAPATATLVAGAGTQPFTATLQSTDSTANDTVVWLVNGVAGGNAAVGTISTAGLYTAPVGVPAPATVPVTAQVTVGAEVNTGSAIVQVVAPPTPVGVVVAPASAIVQAGGGAQSFSATVVNAANNGVVWQVNGIVGGNATVGTISAAGLYTAPSTAPAPATVTVSATSVVAPAAVASALVTVSPASSVVVNPAGANVQAGIGSQPFSATIANAASQAVTWQVNGVTGGNATVGTISSGGVYSAPANVPAGAVTVTAIAVANPALSASASVTVTPPVTVAVTPSTASAQAGIGNQSFVATVGNTTSKAVTWQVNGIAGGSASVGTITPTGVYSAPWSQPAPATVTVTAVAVQDATRSASGSLTVTPPVAVSLSTPSPQVQANIGSVTLVVAVANTAQTAVTWAVNGIAGGNASVGTISPAGTYRAPAAVPSPATVVVTATSVADPTRSANTSLVVTAPVSVSVSPSIASVVAGAKQQFTGVVTNGVTGALNWQVNGVAGGNASVGTVSPAGLYSAPAVVPAPATVTITAISVDDPSKSAAAAATVTAPPVPPTIGGTPATTATVGKAYAFQPTASGAPGVTLTFSVSNLPPWATFSTATGLLSGTPGASATGSYANITIAVTDGTNSATLTPFTITVSAANGNSATLNWVAPTTRGDGTPLTNLAGFRVYYGTSPGSYPNVVTVANPAATSYAVTNLSSGTYYFITTAYDTNGDESAATPQGTKTIP